MSIAILPGCVCDWSVAASPRAAQHWTTVFRDDNMDRAIPILPADDLRLARQFYVDKLGFHVRYDVSEDGVTGLLGIVRGGIEITIDCPMSGHGRRACVSLRVTDADAYY